MKNPCPFFGTVRAFDSELGATTCSVVFCQHDAGHDGPHESKYVEAKSIRDWHNPFAKKEENAQNE